MEDPGQRLKTARERLDLRYREVAQASQRIAEHYQNSEFAIALSRLADIENKGTVPSIYRIYSLCAIYRLDIQEVLRWYGIELNSLLEDSMRVEVAETHTVGVASLPSAAQLPLEMDEPVDWAQTTFLTPLFRRWGRIPFSALNALNLRQHRYGFVGTADWSMFPFLMPGSFVQIDESRRRIVNEGWTHDAERPIYFLEHRTRFYCGWCTQQEEWLLWQPANSAHTRSRLFRFPTDIDVVGQVVAVAMRLDQVRRRHTRF